MSCCDARIRQGTAFSNTTRTENCLTVTLALGRVERVQTQHGRKKTKSHIWNVEAVERHGWNGQPNTRVECRVDKSQSAPCPCG